VQSVAGTNDIVDGNRRPLFRPKKAESSVLPLEEVISEGLQRLHADRIERQRSELHLEWSNCALGLEPDRGLFDVQPGERDRRNARQIQAPQGIERVRVALLEALLERISFNLSNLVRRRDVVRAPREPNNERIAALELAELPRITLGGILLLLLKQSIQRRELTRIDVADLLLPAL